MLNKDKVILGLAKFLGINLGHVWIPKFQTYAQGGVIDRPTAGIMGEYPGAKSNPEIVTPENKMREVFETSNEDIVSVLLQGFKQIIQAINEKENTLSVDGMVLAKSVAKANSSFSYSGFTFGYFSSNATISSGVLLLKNIWIIW